MTENILETLLPNQLAVLLAIAGLLLAIAEIGYRMGKRAPLRDDGALKSEVAGYLASVLGLLALLLGFTFSMAWSHYDLRRNLVLQEANSIGTTYLRTSFLPSLQRDESRKLLRNYTAIRCEAEAAFESVPSLLATESNLQQRLWSQVEEVANLAPNPVTVSYITSLNETIDLQSASLAAARYRIPAALWLILLIVSLFGLWACGFNAGVNRKRAYFLTVGFPVLITLVMFLIVDLNSPRMGLIRTDHSSMTDLRDSMK